MVPNALGLFGPVWGRFVIIGTFDCVWDRSGPCGTVGPVEKIGDRMEHVGTALGTVWDRVGPCGTIGTAGDGWGQLGTAGDSWGPCGTAVSRQVAQLFTLFTLFMLTAWACSVSRTV